MTPKADAAFLKWKAGLDVRHAEYARRWAAYEAANEAAMDARCPASEGWLKIGSGCRIRPHDRPEPPMQGEGI
jgi:hypothetical protein